MNHINFEFTPSEEQASREMLPKRSKLAGISPYKNTVESKVSACKISSCVSLLYPKCRSFRKSVDILIVEIIYIVTRHRYQRDF